MASLTIQEILRNTTVIPVLHFTSAEEAVDVCGRLIDNGLSVLELTMRHPSALACLRQVKARFGDQATIGMGTIVKAAQVRDVIAAGADFGVSPGLTTELSDEVQSHELPFLPGVATVSEAMKAQDMGFSALKFFPAEQSGGVGFLKSVGAVLPEIAFCPTGGITLSNADSYLNLKNVMCVGTSEPLQRNAANKVASDHLEKMTSRYRQNGWLR